MKKSEHLYCAMLAVLDNTKFSAEVRLDVLKLLMDERDTALFVEKLEAEKEEQDA